MGMNTDKTIKEKFIEKLDKPIWYYKELEEVSVYYVINYLLKEHFVVDIEGFKYEIIFGKNRKHEIGQYIRADDMSNFDLTSYETIQKGFHQGKWFIVTDKDTTEEFKKNYDEKINKHRREETKEFYLSILKKVINSHTDINEDQKKKHIKTIEECSFEQLENFFKVLIKSNK